MTPQQEEFMAHLVGDGVLPSPMLAYLGQRMRNVLWDAVLERCMASGGIDYRRIAERIGVSERTVARWFAHRRAPIEQIAALLAAVDGSVVMNLGTRKE